jgi:uncharacterized metal-binding protein YceD (DUF177 family)
VNVRILLDQIIDGGLEITADASDTWVAAAANTLRENPGEPAADPHSDAAPERAEVVLTLERIADQVLVGGRTEIVLLRGCDRCGESVRMTLSGPTKMQYNPPGDLLADADHGLEEDELDVGWHDGQAIDLCAVLMEQLALLAPDRVRCGDPGVVPIDGEGPCELPAGVTAEGADDAPKRANPFAGLQLPE